MSRNKIILISLLALVLTIPGSGQRKDFKFKSQIDGVTTAGWYSLEIPEIVQRNLTPGFDDMRILRPGESDTTEVPYLLKILEDESREEKFPVKVINKSTRIGKLYVTFEMPRGAFSNSMDLEFSESNFDGYVMIEGSQDQKEWFMLRDRMRIVSLNQSEINYSHTSLRYPLTNYAYLRIQVSANRMLNFLHATVRRKDLKPGSNNFAAGGVSTSNNKKERITVTTLLFPHPRLINAVGIEVAYNGDYYRPFTLEALRDSAKSDAGWVYYYNTVVTGYLTSADTNAFSFPRIMTKRFRLTISNFDNEPLTINNVQAKGPRVVLLTKMSPGENFLFYGSPIMRPPAYDLKYFENNIPSDLPALVLGPPQSTGPDGLEPADPLFKRKIWLWIIMGVVIAILGVFTMRLMKGTESKG